MIKLEVGKTYKNRRGDLVKIYQKSDMAAVYKFEGRCNNIIQSFTEEGRYLGNCECDFDLVEEVSTVINLEVGKCYRTRDGERVVRIIHEGLSSRWPLFGDDDYTYTTEGIVSTDLKESERDLVCEVPGPSDFERECETSCVHTETKTSKDSGGIKHDDGKPQFTCLPTKALFELGKVSALGANKYGMHNYRKGIKVSRLLDAAMRHLLAAMQREELDPVDGNNHLASVAWNALVAFQMIQEHPELDDRYNGDAA